MARTLASTVTLALETTGQPVTNMTIFTQRWKAITQQAFFVTDVATVSWIPFVYTDNERKIFEAYVRDTIPKEDTFVNPPCHLCGDPDIVFENRDDQVDVTGVGVYKCGELYDGGAVGGIPENACSLIVEMTEHVCHCVERSLNQTLSASSSEFVPWNIDKGLFQFVDLDKSPVAVSREYGRAPYAPIYSMSGGVQQPVLCDQLSDPARATSFRNENTFECLTVTCTDRIGRVNLYQIYILIPSWWVP
jgi:hypothetical protein